MKVIILPSVYGILAINQSKVLGSIYHDKSTRELADIYMQLQKGTVPGEFATFLTDLKNKGGESFLVENAVYINPISEAVHTACELINTPTELKSLRSGSSLLFNQIGITADMPTIAARTKALSEYIIKQQVAEISAQHDLHIKQAVDTLTDTNKTINILATRLREWYGLHFPELTDKLVDDHYLFTTIIAEFGKREQYNQSIMESKLHMPGPLAEQVFEKSSRSMGGSLDPLDVQIIQDLANRVISLFKFKENLENYISQTLELIAPNMKAVLGPNVASMLIGLAGSLERLAQFPSSTIQVLGAEKALFKALKFGAKTPKHGILFQWHKIRGQKAHLRGKISRMVAGKISILAKVDFYKGQFIGDKISKEIDDKIEHLKKMFPQAPKVKKAVDVKRLDQGGHGKPDSRGSQGQRSGKPDFKKKKFHKTQEKSHFKSKNKHKSGKPN
jgi:nucleolar protein 56